MELPCERVRDGNLATAVEFGAGCKWSYFGFEKASGGEHLTYSGLITV
jgi:hypothetical protein